MSEALITIDHVNKVYQKKDATGKKSQTVALKDVSLTIHKGETLGLVGESGSGKSTLGKMIVGLEKPTSGKIDKQTQNMQIIFQDPYSALNPRLSALDLVCEAIFKEKKEVAIKKAKDILALVGIQGDDVYKQPRQFSGGQRQRIGIARAIVANPDFILCDEPTSALDVSIQTQILELLKELKDQLHLSYLFISHDLGVVEHVCDRIAVMYQGQLVEVAPTEAIFADPQHAYTKRLLQAELPLNPQRAKELLHQYSKNKNQEIQLTDNFEWIEVAENHFVRREKNV